MVSGAQGKISGYSSEAPPEPAFLLHLSNDVYNGATIFAVQKAFEGEFSFDVYYDAAGVERKLDREQPFLHEFVAVGAHKVLS